MKSLLAFIIPFLLLFGCSAGKKQSENNESKPISEYTDEASSGMEVATFAGGCFWCIEAPFEGIDGIQSVVSGYSGGKEKNPSYKEVSAGKTGHKESVQIKFDPEVISYSELVDIYWKLFDPTDAGGSFYDRGTQYQSAIFYQSDEQKRVAEASKKLLGQSGKFDKPIVTPIVKYDAFYAAEEYHQDYYKKNPDHYKSYRKGSGRDEFIRKHWEIPSEANYTKPSKSRLKEKLSDIQYKVAIQNDTERAFNNPYWDNKEEGIYVCIVSGAPLFSSKTKFKSGTGWPSFTKPIDARYLEKPVDKSMGMTRVEVRSKYGESHVGHVFYDGPEPTHLRYCMNSAAMRFIPKEEMEAEGYGNYLWLVE